MIKDFVANSSIKVTGADKERPHTHRQWYYLCHLVFYVISRQCKQVCRSRPHNQYNCCLSESWTDLRSDSFRKECVWLGGSCRPTSCVNILSVPSNLSLPASQFISVLLLSSASPTLSPGSAPLTLSYQCIFLYLHPPSSTKSTYTIAIPSTRSSPPQPKPEAGRQAGRLPAWGPRWCSGESASSGFLSLQDGRTALLWPIWPRPVLAPVCDYGPAGGRQGWHSERTLPVHSRLRD